MSLRRPGKGEWLLILGVALVVMDQIIKILVKTGMALGDHMDLLSWFEIRFVENEGMAFGMAFGGAVGKILLSLFRLVLSVLLVWWIRRLLRRREAVPVGVLVGLTLIAAGAVGNLIDCLCYGQLFSASGPGVVAAWGGHYAPVLLGKVVDMFYFPLWVWPDWVPLLGGHVFFEPVFNFADSCVTVGALYLVFFQWRFFAREDTAAAKDTSGAA